MIAPTDGQPDTATRLQEAAQQACADLGQRTADMQRALVAAFAPLGAELRRTIGAMADLFHALTWEISMTQARKHRRRCRICNPRGNPRGLPIDGHAYARRHRARVRRRR